MTCSVVISGFGEMVTHYLSSHDDDRTQCSLEFDWVLLCLARARRDEHVEITSTVLMGCLLGRQ